MASYKGFQTNDWVIIGLVGAGAYVLYKAGFFGTLSNVGGITSDLTGIGSDITGAVRQGVENIPNIISGGINPPSNNIGYGFTPQGAALKDIFVGGINSNQNIGYGFTPQGAALKDIFVSGINPSNQNIGYGFTPQGASLLSRFGVDITTGGSVAATPYQNSLLYNDINHPSQTQNSQNPNNMSVQSSRSSASVNNDNLPQSSTGKANKPSAGGTPYLESQLYKDLQKVGIPSVKSLF